MQSRYFFSFGPSTAPDAYAAKRFLSCRRQWLRRGYLADGATSGIAMLAIRCLRPGTSGWSRLLRRGRQLDTRSSKGCRPSAGGRNDPTEPSAAPQRRHGPERIARGGTPPTQRRRDSLSHERPNIAPGMGLMVFVASLPDRFQDNATSTMRPNPPSDAAAKRHRYDD